MWRKFLSRKLLAAIAAFVTVNVLPNIPADQQARFSALIAAAYIVAQGFADAFGSAGVGSQGETPPAEIEMTPVVTGDWAPEPQGDGE